jgi:DNA polymerase V
VEKGLVCHQLVLTVGYDMENLLDPVRRSRYMGAVTQDFYGREVPKHAHGSHNFPRPNSSTRLFLEAVNQLCDRILDPELLVRRINITAANVVAEGTLPKEECVQLDLFAEADAERREQQQAEALQRERRRQQAVLRIKHKYGKNAILKGMNLEDGATAKDRNSQVGGHKA